MATFAAFAAATVAAWYAVGAFRLESRREERWEAAQVTAQASMVAAWHGWQNDEPRGHQLPPPIGGTWTSRVEGLLVRNASDVPVTAAEVDLHVSWMSTSRALGRSTAHKKFATVHLGVVPPGSEPVFSPLSQDEVDAMTAFYMDMAVALLEPDLEVTLRFRDAAGVQWERPHSGELVQRSGAGEVKRRCLGRSGRPSRRH